MKKKSLAMSYIQTTFGANFEEFMVLELYTNSLKGISGKFYEDSAFEINKDDLDLFEQQFQYKEKRVVIKTLETERLIIRRFKP